LKRSEKYVIVARMQRSILVRRKKLHRSGGTFITLALTAACCLMSSLPVSAEQQLQARHVPPITKRLAPIGRLDSDKRLNLAIGLPLRNQDKLTNFLQELYQPSSANFHRYLTADQFASSFGPRQEDYEAVVHFAQSHGLHVKASHPNRTLVDVSGSVGGIEKAFHITMRVYQHPTEARTFFAPDVEPSLDLDTPVLAISGLDNYVTPRSHIRWPGGDSASAVHPLGGGSGGGGGGGGSGSGGTYLGYDFRAAYAAGVSRTGIGQSVGLFELAGYDPDDISDYEDEAGLPYVTLQNILIDGADGTDDGDTNLNFNVEVTADIEMAVAMAPGLSSILVYEGPTPSSETNAIQDPETTAQINDVLDRMATDDLAQQLSCSYGMDINLSTVQIFQQFAAQGQSFFLGSGDTGAYGGAVDEPADDPNVTVVGGTTLTTSGPEGSWVGESVWLTPASDDPLLGYSPEEASGGGVSLTYGIPTYQQGISMTANQGSTTMRNMPDVALVANNVDVVFGNDLIGESFDFTVSGTSLATPLWAGFMALVNEQAAANGQPPVGFVNPALYAIGKSTSYHSCFHDITQGDNYTTDSPTKYKAASGYDLCTGWGSMIGSNLMQSLLTPPSESLLIKPPLGFTSFGPGRGPFSVTSQTYMLTNIGPNPLNWSLINTSAWLNVSAAGGALRPGGPAATVTVSLNLAASNFFLGNYSGNVPIADTTDGVTQNREFDLYVGNGGFETGDFTDWTLIGDPTLDFPLSGDDVDVAGTNALSGEADELFVHSGLYGAYLGEWPDTGSLSQAVATTSGRQYLVSFWLTSVPYEGSTVPNSFAAVWNGSALFSQTNLDAFGWTNMQYIVSATSAKTTLEFDFDDVPGAFGLDDVSVEPAPAPVFQSAAVTNHTIVLTWSAIANFSYQIQSAGNLLEPDWTNAGVPIVASGNSVSASEPTGSESHQYYRVILVANP
jgi:hypothetical protein